MTYTSVRGIPALARQQRPLVTAMSAIDIALWDLKGKAIGRPVHALLGGALRQRVPAYVTGFYYRDGERPDDLVREAALYLEHGYRTVKVKVGGLTPEADAERVGLIRKAVGKDVAIMLDANQGWDLPTAVRAAQLCAPHDIFWLEDPMPWYDERHTLARLKDAVRHPHRGGRDGVHPVRPAHDGGRGAGRLLDHRLHVGRGAHDLAQGRGDGRAVPGTARRASRSPDPRARGGGQPDRIHPRVVRRSHP